MSGNAKAVDRGRPSELARAKLGTKVKAAITQANLQRTDSIAINALLTDIRTRLLNHTKTNGVLAIGTTSAAEIKVTNAVDYVAAGVLGTLAAAEYAFTATTHDITADAGTVQEAVYLLSVDGAGSVTVTKGTTATGAGNAVVPATPTDEAPLGYLRLAVAAGATDFDATSDLLSAGHLTDTYVNLSFDTVGLAAAVSDSVGAALTNLR